MEEVLAKYFSDEVSKDERSLVENWRSESETNAKAFFEAKSVWLSSQQIGQPKLEILEEILRGKEAKQVRMWNSRWMKYAAAASIVLAITLLYFLGGSGDIGYQTKSLADGSKVALHGDSKLEIINLTDEIREVRITGKAYFDIERDENRPFVIHTENAIVKVLGTSFVVNSYNAKTEVSVESGLVELIKTNKDVSVKLGQGEMGLVLNTNDGIIKKNNNDLNYLSWKTKVLTFKETNMEEVSEVIEDVYGIKVKFENADFKNCKLTAKFNKKNPKDAIEIIARTFNVKYDYSNGVAVLKGKGC